MRVWPSSYPSWSDAIAAGQTGTVAMGKSQAFNLNNIGGGTNGPANLIGLRSFSLAYGLVESQTPPYILTQSGNQTVIVGETAAFSVLASSGCCSLNYQWRSNAVNIVGATNSSLTLTAVQVSYAADYSVMVSNSVG